MVYLSEISRNHHQSDENHKAMDGGMNGYISGLQYAQGTHWLVSS